MSQTERKMIESACPRVGARLTVCGRRIFSNKALFRSAQISGQFSRPVIRTRWPIGGKGCFGYDRGTELEARVFAEGLALRQTREPLRSRRPVGS